MSSSSQHELYQQVILDHNKKPHNFGKLEKPTHFAEGYNPLCGDHLQIYLNIDPAGKITDIAFEGSGCAISKASASMMTTSLKGKTVDEAKKLFDEFHQLVIGKLDPNQKETSLGKLSIFSGIWQYPARVKCAILSWYAMKGALNNIQSISTETK